MSENINEIINIKQLLSRIKHNWFFIFIGLFISISIAFTYNRYSTDLYRVESSVFVKQDNDISSASDLLYNNSIVKDDNNISNKILLLRSFPLIYKTLEDLRYDISYSVIGRVKKSEIYKSPVNLICPYSHNLQGRSLIIQILDDKKFKINKDTSVYSFGKEFLFFDTPITILLDPRYYNEYKEVYIQFFSLKKLTKEYKKRIKVYQKDRESSVLNISILIPDQYKGVVFLNKLIDNYIQSEIQEKSMVSKNTVNFINNQLIEMRDSLSLIEQQIQEYKNKNNITDLSLKAQSIYTNIAAVESELVTSQNINNYYDYLEKYLEQGKAIDGVSVPTSFGVDDPAINLLTDQLVEIQIKKDILIAGGQINNPAIVQYNRQIKQLVINIKESINTNRSANNLRIKDIKGRILDLEKSLNTIPEVERELLSIERLQSISEKVYTFLLTKRAEAKINYSSIVSDSKILEPAMYFNKNPEYPNKRLNIIIAILFGFILPIFIIFFLEFLSNKINTREDIISLTDIPIISMLGKNYSGYNLLFNHNPKSSLFEGFRGLRTSLDFLTNKNKGIVYMVTSTVSSEGKTYISSNLSIVLSRSDKRTLLIGADLRRPKIYSDFGHNNNVGLSNYLSGKCKLEEVVKSTKEKNLDLLLAGPLPVNPAELFIGKKFANLMDKLKDIYDVIVIDTPPIGLVSDSLVLVPYVDISLFIVRQYVTSKKSLNYLNDINSNKRLGNVQIIFNDIADSNDGYGYGYNYGYSIDSDYFSNEK